MPTESHPNITEELISIQQMTQTNTHAHIGIKKKKTELLNELT